MRVRGPPCPKHTHLVLLEQRVIQLDALRAAARTVVKLGCELKSCLCTVHLPISATCQ